jgi:hypothetical protein
MTVWSPSIILIYYRLKQLHKMSSAVKTVCIYRSYHRGRHLTGKGLCLWWHSPIWHPVELIQVTINLVPPNDHCILWNDIHSITGDKTTTETKRRWNTTVSNGISVDKQELLLNQSDRWCKLNITYNKIHNQTLVYFLVGLELISVKYNLKTQPHSLNIHDHHCKFSLGH